MSLTSVRSPRCFDVSSQRSHQYDLPASSGWRLCHQQTSATSFTPQKRVTGTSSAFLTCSWAASRKLSRCSWKPKAQPSLALPAWPLAKVSPLSRCPWSSTPGELSVNQPHSHSFCQTFFPMKKMSPFPPHSQLHSQRGEPLVDERIHSSSDSRNNHKTC